MTASDFEYDGLLLSDIGYMICQFDESSGFNSSPAGTDMSVTTVAQFGGRRFSIVDTRYKDRFETTFSICKRDGSYVDTTEYEFIMRWLSRTSAHKLVILTPEWQTIYFTGTFNIEKVELHGSIVGFNLKFISTSVFGWGDQESASFTIQDAGGSYEFEDTSDEVGHVYPDTMKITVRAAGDMTITNSVEPGRETIIKGCAQGEVITISGKTFSLTTSANRNIYNVFNFVYPRISNSMADSSNTFTFSLPCDVEMSYTPIRRAVF